MPPHGQFSLAFPMAGVQRRFAVSNQRPFSTPDALNVRPDGTVDGRERGGSRPGTKLAFPDSFDGSIRLINKVGVAPVESSDQTVFDDFESYTAAQILSAPWTLPEHDLAVDALPLVYTFGGSAHVYSFFADGPDGLIGLQFSACLPIFFDIDTSIAFDLTATIGSQVTDSFLGTIQLYAFLDNDFPNYNLSSGDFVRVVLSGSVDVWVLTFTIVQGGETLFSDVVTITAPTKELFAATNGKIRISYQPGSVQFYLGILKFAEWFTTDHHKLNGNRVGFSIRATIGIENRVHLSDFLVEWKTKEGVFFVPRDILVISPENGRMYRDELDGSIVEITGPSLTSRSNLESAEYLQRLFIADTPSPKVYDTFTDELSTWEATVGEVPQGCPLIARYNNRMVLAGNPPNEWFMSRKGDPDFPANPFDWDFLQLALGDNSGAVLGISSDAGTLGEPITALISHSDDFLIFGCLNTLWVLRGDPGDGGFIENKSEDVGVLGARAWAHDANLGLYFMSRDGLYWLPPGATTLPTSVSRERLPRELVDIDISSNTVVLGFDIIGRGIHIYVTGNVAGGFAHWFYDLETRGFWPFQLPLDQDPFSLLSWTSASPSRTQMLLGCRDGRLRVFSSEATSDDGISFPSHVLYGPFLLGGGGQREGMLDSLFGVPAIGSGSINWSVKVGDTAEEALAAEEIDSGTWLAGSNPTDPVRARGKYMFLKLEGNGSAWAIEEIVGERHGLGRLRA